jgi:hypothetical protein
MLERNPWRGPMNYLCLVYSEYTEQELGAMPEQELNALISESLEYDDELRRSGYFVEARALQPVETATTVRVRNGRISMTDGPFVETKEWLSGFILIEARDLNEALQVASKIPSARYGSIEVRPVRELKRR